MKKFLALLFIVLIAVFAFSGCIPTSDSNLPTDNGSTTSPDTTPPSSDTTPDEEITKMYLTINGNKIEVTLADNPSVDALVELLKKDDITYTADTYGGFEMVGNIGHTLPRNDTYITTEPGDVMLYLGSNIVLFYGNNSYDYTRLGKIKGYSLSELKTLLCAGSRNVEITISLE